MYIITKCKLIEKIVFFSFFILDFFLVFINITVIHQFEFDNIDILGLNI